MEVSNFDLEYEAIMAELDDEVGVRSFLLRVGLKRTMRSFRTLLIDTNIILLSLRRGVTMPLL